MKRIFLILAAIGLLSASACSLRKKPTGEDFYQQGQDDFANHEYKAAVENYQKLIDQYPFSPYEEDAELKIGLAQYQEKNYAEAIAALDDFQRMHPTSKQLDLVTYYIAMSYYDQIGREDQDQSKTEAAMKRFEEIEQRFPEGNFDELAREHVSVCREMLARHAMVVGNFYYKRANFRAAESRFAELMQKYPDTPVAPDALWDLAVALQKEGKKYSAAQAYAALEMHFPHSPYAGKARAEMRKLHQTIDTEEDPLPMVLAETGFPMAGQQELGDNVSVRQRDSSGSASGTMYGEDGLPILSGSSAGGSGGSGTAPNGGGTGSSISANGGGLPGGAAPPPSSGVASALAASGGSPPPANPVAGDFGSAAPPAAAAAGASGVGMASALASQPAPKDPGSMVPGGDMLAMNTPHAGTPPPNPSLPTAVSQEPPPAQMHELTSLASPPPDGNAAGSPDSGGSAQPTQLQPTTPIQSEPVPGANTALANAPAPEPGPATLKTIRLSANDPPLTVIFDLTGPVRYDKSIETNPDGSAKVTVVLKDVTPDGSVGKHVVFDRSIFKDCDISKSTDGTTITLNMQPITSFSVVPLDEPARLLVTFTPQSAPDTQKTSAIN
jgi:outer membrane protein assembly factor BamD